VGSGFVSWDDLECAILEQERLATMNLHFRLGEILVSMERMKFDEVLDTLRRQQKRIMICPLCDNHYNVVGFNRDRVYQCVDCQADLLEPGFLETVAVDGFIEDSVPASAATERS